MDVLSRFEMDEDDMAQKEDFHDKRHHGAERCEIRPLQPLKKKEVATWLPHLAAESGGRPKKACVLRSACFAPLRASARL